MDIFHWVYGGPTQAVKNAGRFRPFAKLFKNGVFYMMADGLMSVTRLRVGYVVVFIIGVLSVALGAYATCYFFLVGHSRTTYLLGGLGAVAFGIVLIRASYLIFVPLKKYFVPAKSCPCCGAILKEDATICEKCKQPLDSTND